MQKLGESPHGVTGATPLDARHRVYWYAAGLSFSLLMLLVHARALVVAQAAGFIKTEFPPIIVNWHKPLHENIRRALTAKVVALGAF